MTLDPHRVYIEFLSTRHPSEGAAWAVLDALRFPRPLPGSFQRIRDLQLQKAPLEVRRFLNGQQSLDSMQPLWDWAIKQRFGVLWAQVKIFKLHDHPQQKCFDRVWSLVRNEAIRDTMDAVLMQQWATRHAFDLELLNDVLNLKFGETLDEGNLDMYRSIFFNPSRVAKENWINYLNGCHPTKKEMLLLAMEHKDEKRFRHEIGAAPRFQYTELLSDVIATSYYRFKEADADGADLVAMKGFSKILMEAGDRREKYGQRDIKDLRRDLQMGFDFLEAEFPTIEDIESGRVDAAMGNPRDPE